MQTILRKKFGRYTRGSGTTAEGKIQCHVAPVRYEKTRVDVEAEKLEAKNWGSTLTGTWPIGGFWAIKKAIDTGYHLQARASEWRTRR
jgi:hypothetical protein